MEAERPEDFELGTLTKGEKAAPLKSKRAGGVYVPPFLLAQQMEELRQSEPGSAEN